MKDIKRPSRSLGHKLIDGVECLGYEVGGISVENPS